MSYAQLPSDVRETAERILTRKQLDVFRMRYSGATIADIARAVDRSETTVAQHLRRAEQLIAIELRKEVA